MPQSLCPLRQHLYQHMLAKTRLYFQVLREDRFAGDSEQVGPALQDYDLIEALAAVLDGYLLIGVYNDLEKLAQSRVLYVKHPKNFIPDLDDLFFAEAPKQFGVKAEGKRRPSHRQAYVNYFRLFIRPANLRQQGDTLNGVAAFFARHPLLRHVLETLTSHFQQNIELAIERLLADWDDVYRVFGLNPAAKLCKITPTGSDSHKGGKQVLIFEFSEEDNGQLRKLVYKPSDVEIDYRLIGNTREMPITTAPQGESLTETTNRMLVDSNIEFAKALLGNAFQAYTATQKEAVSERLRLPTYRILPRNPGSTLPVTNGKLNIQQSYGYLEFVTHDPALKSPWSINDYTKEDEIVGLWENNSPEVRNQFDWITDDEDDGEIAYRQWGQLMAMAHVFSITDLHVQNQIVSRKKPTLIDLEVAFNAPGDSLNRSAIIIHYQKDNDPDSQNALEIDKSLQEFIPAALFLPKPDNKHPFNQLYCYVEEIVEEEGEIETTKRAIREKEANHRDALYEGVHSLLATYRNPANNADLRAWLQSLTSVVVRLVPEPTESFIQRLTGWVHRHSNAAFPPYAIDKYWEMFGNNSKTNIRAFKEWYQNNPKKNWPNPYPILHQPDLYWRDLVAMDVPSYYRRIGELDLRDARGKVVNLIRAINSQYAWLNSKGLVTAEGVKTPLAKLQAILIIAVIPNGADGDVLTGYTAEIMNFTKEIDAAGGNAMFVHGRYFTETGIDQANQRLVDLGGKNNQEFELYITALMRKSFMGHTQGERMGILTKLFEGLSVSTDSNIEATHHDGSQHP